MRGGPAGGAGEEPAAGRGSVLAVDAGNSKTDVAVIGADGSVLGAARGGGFQPPKVGIGPALDTLERAVTEAASAAGLPVRDLADQVSACLANADLPVEERELARAVRERGWGRTTRVRNDTFAVLRAGLPGGAPPRGVAVVCGAGINCAGLLPDGRTARFPAVGRLSGDWGGGSGLSEEALWLAARAEDGRGEPTELARTLPGHFGLGSMDELIEALHLGRIPFAGRYELTPVLFETCTAGDAVAASVVDRLAEEVVLLATVALERLGLLGEETPVVLGGSVLAARHPRLDGRIRVLMAARAPKAVVGVVTAPPVLGAGLLGLDQAGANARAYTRLAAHYA
ncbi:N-acetylglucosamine kinase [Streptomyces corynorhini]|uniref:N-acetylglucosamine kinase n=1 Tax=Streptomyces corynorhini TaxID=2282652 RepID=UPI001F3C771E|nr:BadF/BadG/BcrA/BcrD ATPase family protein [Streptomyces corynorhini]